MKPKESLNVYDFKGLKITLASPADILSWSHGEVTKPETINYRTLKPEKDGLFDERIFGPTKDWECYCGKYKRIRYRGIICDKCGVEVTQSRVRRERMGHISLSSPVTHVWFFKGAPSKLSLLLDIQPRNLESVIYFGKYLIKTVSADKKEGVLKKIEARMKQRLDDVEKQRKDKEKELTHEITAKKRDLKNKIKNREQIELAMSELEILLKHKIVSLHDAIKIEREHIEELHTTIANLVKSLKRFSVLSEDEYIKLLEYDAADFFTVGMGAEAMLSSIKELDLDKLTSQLRQEAQESAGAKHTRASKRLRVIEGMRKAGIDPSWMILTVLPVIPPDLRPMVQLTGGRFATSDLNDLYRRVINRNNRLAHLIELGAPEIILRNEKRMLQEAVDALIDASQRPTTRVLTSPLRSLSDGLRGKQGRFRQNLLGKRVDYSGRSVIVVGPELMLTQCGLPKEMALEMFKPFVLREVIAKGYAPNVKSAKHFIERKPPEIFDILEEITRDHPVLLNRAPTLHKLGIQAFYPILIEGSAIRIHPCVCAGYNADFDGDQMAVHIPLSSKAKEEAMNLMLPNQNLLKPADGSPITLPNKEMALGVYYLTLMEPGDKDQRKPSFSDTQEAVLAYQSKKIRLRQSINVRINGKVIETTTGRILFNEVLPEDFQFMNETVKAGTIKQILTKALSTLPQEDTTRLIDAIKEIGFFGATISGISVSLFDNEIVKEKDTFINEAERKVAEIDENYQKGLITNEEKKRLSNDVWLDVTDKIADITWNNLKPDNAVRIIIESGGARASKDQLKQLAAMRGLVVDPLGKIVELPTKSNFREGLSIFEYVTSTRGSRKGLTDSALKTADAGYLTRRLVDVAHDVIIRKDDCGSTNGIEILRSERRRAAFEERVVGRVLARSVTSGRKVLLKEGELILEDKLELLHKNKVEAVTVRSPLTCEAKYGLCQRCYGWDFSNKKLVEVGVPVGVIAAQSIGEPGTQLTMRVRHFGGVVMSDVTQGLPRVEEIFEVREPKAKGLLSEIAGKAEVKEENAIVKIIIRSVGIKPVEEREYLIPAGSKTAVASGELISAGTQLSGGPLDLREVLEIRGLQEAQKYIIEEIQNVYESQGIPINDKHFEVIVRKMSDKVRVDKPGDTVLLPGELVNRTRFEKENASVLAEGGEPATAQVVILGITRASLYTESWLSAASFQETTSVLTDAAIQGKEDNLLGLKENVIIGRLIPTSPEWALIEE